MSDDAETPRQVGKAPVKMVEASHRCFRLHLPSQTEQPQPLTRGATPHSVWVLRRAAS